MPTVLHIHSHPWAGMPHRMEVALDKRRLNDWSATRIQMRPGVAKEMKFPEGRHSLSDDDMWEAIRDADIVHMHGTDVCQNLGRYEHALRGTPTFLTIHGEPDRIHVTLKRVRELADRVHVVTPDLLEMYPGSKFIPNFVLDGDVAAVPPGRPGSNRVLLYRPIGHKWKNHDKFSELAQWCFEHGIVEPTVQLGKPGSVPNHVVLLNMAQHNVVWDHLHGYFGVTTIEAMAMNCVPITTMTGQCVGELARFFGSHVKSLPIFWEAMDNVKFSLLQMQRHPETLEESRRAVHDFWRRHWREELFAKRWADEYTALLEAKS